MRLIDSDAMVQRLEERLKELYHLGPHTDEDDFYDILIDHLQLDCEIRTLKEWINKQPTIEAEPVRRGRWLFESICQPDEYCVCSECGTQVDSNEAWHYCPNCGARMEEQEE